MPVEKPTDPVLSRRGRQWATLVVLGLFMVDVIAGVSIWAAGRLRSRGLAILAAVFALIGVQDLFFWHGRFGRTLYGYFDFGFLPAADSSAWGSSWL